MSNLNKLNSWTDTLFCSPEIVIGSLDISDAPIGKYKNLTSKVKIVHGDFYCDNCHLESLKGAPRIDSDCDFQCPHNLLTSFEGINNYICSNFNIAYNGVTSLVDIHKRIKRCDMIDLSGNPIIKGGIGLILIEDLCVIEWEDPSIASFRHVNYNNFSVSEIIKIKHDINKAFKIIEKYLGKGISGLLDCQEELIDSNLEVFAIL